MVTELYGKQVGNHSTHMKILCNRWWICSSTGFRVHFRWSFLYCLGAVSCNWCYSNMPLCDLRAVRLNRSKCTWFRRHWIRTPLKSKKKNSGGFSYLWRAAAAAKCNKMEWKAHQISGEHVWEKYVQQWGRAIACEFRGNRAKIKIF